METWLHINYRQLSASILENRETGLVGFADSSVSGKLASGLKEKEEEAQISALIYMMGDKAEDILRSFGLKDEDKKKYKVVRDRYDACFVKKRNVIYERAKFNLRKQEDGEPVDNFVTSLICIPWSSIATLETCMMK